MLKLCRVGFLQGTGAECRLTMFALLILSFFSISSCQQTGGTREVSEDYSALQKELATREVESMQLRMQILQKDDEINRLTSSQEQAVKEVVRAKARLRSHSGKAETVANMAEVRMMLQSTRESASTVKQKQTLKRANQYLTMGDAELDEENYEGAAYLVGKARELVRPTGSGNGIIIVSEDKEATFYSPIRMYALSRSNVREEANISARILFNVNAKTQVLAIAYKGPWLKIRFGNGKVGWIYYKLVDITRRL